MTKQNLAQAKIRNIAIVAHVDHGKTTLVDAMLRQSGVFRTNEAVVEQVMDSNDLERERGITILAKNTAIMYDDVRINVIDTPGHADFGGEVERVLKMVDGILLVVDAYDGTMPQTRFVLQKALAMNLKPIVVINKIDRPDARPEAVLDMILELFIELGATDEQIDFPVVYTSGKVGVASLDLSDFGDESTDAADLRNQMTIEPLLETILREIPCPYGDPDAPLQLLISNLDYDSYLGKLAIGRIERGTIRTGSSVAVLHCDGLANPNQMKIGKIMVHQGLSRNHVDHATVGEIVCVSGLDKIEIGATICAIDCLEALPFVNIDEPTIAMTFSVNDSPFAGKSGKFVTSRHLRERLYKEVETNVSLRVEDTDTTDAFVVKGRGELHLSILIETMRREGYELQVSKPSVILRSNNGVTEEPLELLTIDVPEGFTGVVIEKLGGRRAELVSMLPPEKGMIRMEFQIPTRGLIGYRTEFLSDTRGNGILNSIVSGYIAWKGNIETRPHGVLVSFENGETTSYGLYHAEERGVLFVNAGTPVYEGMIVGSCPRNEDITVNVCKRKHVTNMRASGADDALRVSPPTIMSLEQCLEFIADDELVEVTPNCIRLRKRILNAGLRAKQKSK